ncbi:MAG: CBS domain-containing protein [Actinomycetota bacterium]|nr:CBS domain-containing protein [Actinomycetota bacterium]
MTTAREIMTAPVVVAHVDDSVARIAAVLDHHRISAVPVVDGDGGVVGLVSEYDLLTTPAGPTARDIMSTAVVSVTADTDVEDVRHLLVDRRIHRVPVVSGGTLVGIVSRADIVALLITEWVCPVCGESVRGDQPPMPCPKCHSTQAFVIQEQPPGP